MSHNEPQCQHNGRTASKSGAIAAMTGKKILQAFTYAGRKKRSGLLFKLPDATMKTCKGAGGVFQ